MAEMTFAAFDTDSEPLATPSSSCSSPFSSSAIVEREEEEVLKVEITARPPCTRLAFMTSHTSCSGTRRVSKACVTLFGLARFSRLNLALTCLRSRLASIMLAL